MKVTIETSLGSHRRDIRTYEDVIDLMHNITKRWCGNDNDWVGA